MPVFSVVSDNKQLKSCTLFYMTQVLQIVVMTQAAILRYNKSKPRQAAV